MNAPKPVTLATLNTATAQEVFDWVVYNLRKQGAKSLRKAGSNACVYRSPEGLKCAAGWLMADEEYCKHWDYPLSSPWLEVAEILELHGHENLVAKLQAAHDWCPVSDWESEWRRIALAYNLSYSPP